MRSSNIKLLIVNTDNRYNKEHQELVSNLRANSFHIKEITPDEPYEEFITRDIEEYHVIVIRQTDNDKDLWKQILNKAKKRNPFTEIMVINSDDEFGQQANTILNSGVFAYFVYPRVFTLPGYIKAALQHAEERSIRTKFSRILNSANSVKHVGRLLIAALYELLGFDTATFVLLNRSELYENTWTRTLVHHKTHPHTHIDWKLLKPISPFSGFDNLIYEILNDRKAKICPDVRELGDRWIPESTTFRVKSWLVLPIFYNNEPIALATLDSYTSGFYSYDRISQSTLEQIGNQVGAAISSVEQTTVSKRLKEAFENVEKSTGPNLNITLDSIAAQAGELVGGILSYVCVTEQDGAFLRVKGKWSANPHSVPWSLFEGFYTEPHNYDRNLDCRSGITTLAWWRKRPVLLNDIWLRTKSGDLVYDEEVAHNAYAKATAETSSDLAVPIIDQRNGEKIGVINVEHKNPFAFTRSHINAIERLAEFAAVAIQHSEAYRQSLIESKRLAALLAAGRAIVSQIASKDPDNFRNTLADQACIAADAAWVAVNMFDDGQFREWGWSSSIPNPIRDSRPHRLTGPSHSTWSIRTQKPVIIKDTDNYEKNLNQSPYLDEHNRPIPINPQTRDIAKSKAVLGIPLILGNSAIGVIWFHYNEIKSFETQEIDSLTLFAHFAAAAMEQEESYKRIDKERNLLSNVFTTVAEIQDEDRWSPVLRPLIEAATDLVHAKHGAIYLDFPDKRKLWRMDSTFDVNDMPLHEALDYSQGVAGRAFTNKDLFQVKDYRKWKYKIHETKELGAVIGICIRDTERSEHGKPIGVLIVSRTAGKIYDAKEKKKLREFANSIAPLLTIHTKLGELQTLRPRVEKDFVFVAFTYNPDGFKTYQIIKKAAIGAGLKALSEDELSRKPDYDRAKVVPDHIQQHIRRARFVVAELSGASPNVYWEHGFAWATDHSKLITIAKEGLKLPIDLDAYIRITYTDDYDLETKLTEALSDKVKLQEEKH